MTNTLSRTPMPLRDLLYELSLAKEIPDAELLDDFIRRHPEHACALTDFAVALVVERFGRDKQTEAPSKAAEMGPVVSRAMSRYQNALYANRATNVALTAQNERSSEPAADPFAALDRQAFRQLARELNATPLFVCKLRDRQIDPSTLTDGFLRFVADKLKSLPEVIASYLAAPPRPAAQGQYFKAEGKPTTGLRQSFEGAVRTSGLTDEQQRHLLTL